MRPGATRPRAPSHQGRVSLMASRSRFRVSIVAISTLIAWWWLMMAIHELGHVLGSLLSGATVEAVVLWPWSISETVRSGSHTPLVDTWAGPIFDMIMPALIWITCRRLPSLAAWVGGWAGFCLVANGVYLAAGWIESAGDAADLVHLGMPVWSLVTVGTTSVSLGLWCWHVLIAQRRASHALSASHADRSANAPQ